MPKMVPKRVQYFWLGRKNVLKFDIKCKKKINKNDDFTFVFVRETVPGRKNKTLSFFYIKEFFLFS